MKDAIQITVKVSPKTVDRLEALRPFVASEQAYDASRADVARKAMSIGLRALERQKARDGELDVSDEEEDEDGPATGMVRALFEEKGGTLTSVDIPSPPPNVVDREGKYFRRVGGTTDAPHYIEGSRPEAGSG